ncbi:MAG: hypothetical protein K2W95_28495 [Candidatus Obscuribacterales bacterium]|nr:hypothetical protein [Candidatus Obscuribacterales bacterium]
MKSELSPVSAKQLIATVEGTDSSQGTGEETSKSLEAELRELTFDPNAQFEVTSKNTQDKQPEVTADRGVQLKTRAMIWTGCAIAVLSMIGAAVFYFTQGHGPAKDAKAAAPTPVAINLVLS